MTVTLHPLGFQVLVRLRPLPEKTGSIIRVGRNEYAREADVVAVGPDVRDVSAGDVVLCTALAGQAVGGDLLIPETAVLAFLERAAVISGFPPIPPEKRTANPGVAEIFEDTLRPSEASLQFAREEWERQNAADHGEYYPPRSMEPFTPREEP